jgi:L,D-peptidoglycan transpeptidase YkuD (ErfK/YbiS/YcfS/YnhG family)
LRSKTILAQKNRRKPEKRPVITVFALPGSRAKGLVRFRNLTFPAALGRGGITALKREGDGSAPRGLWRLMGLYYRPDRLPRPIAALPTLPLRKQLGWCDAPFDRNYNRRVSLPYNASAERLWRDDGLYDALVVIDYNSSARSMGRGSAIFLHIARGNFAPTDGCIALKHEHLLRLLAALPPGARIAVGHISKRINVGAAGSNRGRSPAFRGQASWRPP